MAKVRVFLPKDASDEEIVAIINEAAELAKRSDAPPTLQRMQPGSNEPQGLQVAGDILGGDDEVSSESL